ncbi:Tn3 family transposase [Micromonospora rubida]|uniref:Tn3 family transposase n=1 Tax=Micromonospora rubida TaxID=2697657 RepID=UPI00191C4938|nr:Tn3 family transposase [Micromonospora rubida]
MRRTAGCGGCRTPRAAPWASPCCSAWAARVRTGTASTEAILRRFTRAASHPTYQAMLEVGRAVKTAFVARYLRDRDLQREIHDGLNVAEGWNGGNQVLFYGKGGDIATNRRDEQELSVACLHVLQASVAYVNTLLVQDVLAEPAWSDTLTAEDRRGLTPLFWTHVAPYGEVTLNMTKRLELRGETASNAASPDRPGGARATAEASKIPQPSADAL